MDTVRNNLKTVKMIAHRGLSGIEKENTCSAFVAAGNRSYFGIETDVHLTKDGMFIIIHDETLERITNGKSRVNVEENDYFAVENIVLPDLDGNFERRDLRIPLLSEYINICKKYEKVCVLEVKNHFEKDDLIRMVAVIMSLNYIDRTIFISFDIENCINLRKILPQSSIQWLTCDIMSDVRTIETLCKNHIDVDVYYKSLTPDIVSFLHSKGFKINCWTCDDKHEAQELINMGVDFITSNILE